MSIEVGGGGKNSGTTLNCEIKFLDGLKYKVTPTLDPTINIKKIELKHKVKQDNEGNKISFTLNPEEETEQNEYIFEINEQLEKDIEVEIIINGDGGGEEKITQTMEISPPTCNKKNIHEILGIKQDQSLDIFKKFPENELYRCRDIYIQNYFKNSEGLFNIVNQGRTKYSTQKKKLKEEYDKTIIIYNEQKEKYDEEIGKFIEKIQDFSKKNLN